MRLLASLILATLVAAVSPASAGPSESGASGSGGRPDVELPLEGAVTNPDWAEKPTGEQFANYYPPVAEMLSLKGRSTVDCEVVVSGALQNCKITLETPAGMGFGEAALAMTKYFRMRPKTVDGVSVAGAKVRIPIAFNPAPEEDDPSLAPTTTPVSAPAPSAKAIELARRLANLSYSPERVRVWTEQWRDQLATQFANVKLTEEQQAALDAYISAGEASVSTQIEARAAKFARLYSEQQLAEIDQFLESPAGRAWINLSADEAKDEVELASRMQKTIRDQARLSFCSKFKCLETQPALQAK